MRKAIL